MVIITGAFGGIDPRHGPQVRAAQGAKVALIARTGFTSQMTDQALDPQGHDNLFEPVDEDRGLGAAAAGAGVATMRAGRE